MRTFNINPFPVDAKKNISEPKLAVQEKSNPKSFKSILESVQTEKKDQNKVSDLKDSKKSEAVSSAPETKTPEESVNQKAESVAEEKIDRPASGNEKIAKKDTEKKSISDAEKTEDDSELASITVELDVEDISQDNALAQSLLMAVDNASQSENQEIALESGAGEIASISTDEVTTVDISEKILSESAFENEKSIADSETEIDPEKSENIASLSVGDPSTVAATDTTVQENLIADENVLAVETSMPESEKLSNFVADNDVASKDSSDSKPKADNLFTVTDLRTSDETSTKIASTEESNNENSMDMDMNGENVLAGNQAFVQTQNDSTTAETPSFQQMLAQQIQNGAQELVKAGSIVLKDNNTGSINMVLKPESLGNVKVSLELSDKILSGQIVVQSKEAFEAFRQNMDTLRQAFQANGFENANLNLVLADNASSNGAFGQGQQGGDQYMASKTYGDYAQGEVAVDSSTAVDSYTNGGNHQIDVVA